MQRKREQPTGTRTAFSGAAAMHTIHRRDHHWVWDQEIPPVATVAPGDIVELQTNDPGGGQIDANSDASAITRLDFSRVNPVTGPIYIDGAIPGDAVVVRIRDVQASGWGWSAIIPGFGLLAEDFKEPVLCHWRHGPGAEAALFGKTARVPLKPLVGAVGLAPGEAGAHEILPPRRVGGTMDIRDLGAGAELILPVEVDGGLLSFGDGHAAQGDGEVCGTGIETSLSVTAKIDLLRGEAPPGPQLRLSGPVTRHLDSAGYDVTTGIGPDLMSCARDATRAMIDRLERSQGISAEDAYILCSVCGDLRISEIVDMPNWIVALYFPRVVFQ